MIIRRLRERLRGEKAGGILVGSIIAVMLFCLCLAFAMDLSKGAYAKNTQNTQTQNASTLGTRVVNPRGSLTEESAEKAVNEYLRQRNYAGETSVYRSKLNCTDIDVEGVGNVSPPYIEVTLQAANPTGGDGAGFRGMGSNGGTVRYIYKNGAFSGPKVQPGDPVYKVMSMKTHDTTATLMMGMFGKPCMNLNSTTSSISFGNQEDLGKDYE